MTIETARKAAILKENIESFTSFVTSLDEAKESPIKSLYLITESDYRIEIKKKFSPETSIRIFDLLLKSRKAILSGLIKELESI